MAMHKSDELSDVATVLYQQLSELSLKPLACAFAIADEKDRSAEIYITANGMVIPQSFKLPYHGEPTQEKIFKAWRTKGDSHIIIDLQGDALTKHLEFIAKILPLQEFFEMSGESQDDRLVLHLINFKYGFIGLNFKQPIESAIPVFLRFAQVFEQTYTRFLDLQKAEAQAREATIEAALERVRSRSMAMHQSTDMLAVADVLFQQLRSLGGNLWGSGVVICKTDVDDDEVWFANEKGVLPPITLPHTEDPTHKQMYDSWSNNMGLISITKEGPELKAHYDYMLSVPSVSPLFDNILSSGLSFPEKQTWYAAYFSFGYILTITLDPYPEEQILTRFAKVFEQAYTRFLDLKKAEAQAREAQIEASLERVRSQAMAMRHSDDLVTSTMIVFDELEELDLSIQRSGIGIFDPETKDCQLWTTVVTQDGNKELATGITSLTVHPMLIATFDAWKSQKSYSYVLEGKELEEYYGIVSKSDFLLSEEVIGKSASLPKEYYHYTPFQAGGLYFFSDSEPVNVDKQIIRRFAEVFDQTYTRFLDLQKAEAQAHEAQIEAALEKVRSRSLAMHKADELGNVVSVIVEKLMELGVVLDANGVMLCTYFQDSKDVSALDFIARLQFRWELPPALF